MKCILPYSNCVYCLVNKDCSDSVERPYKKEAKCYRISGKKKMLVRARVESTSEFYPPLKVSTYRVNHDKSELLVYVGNTRVATLKLNGNKDKRRCWYLVNEYENPIPMGNTELDAVEATLKHLGYYEESE